MNGLSAYKQVENSKILTQSPHELVGLMFSGVIKNLSEAKKHIENKNVPLKGKSIQRAIDLVLELKNSLDFEKGKEISVNLNDIYDFCIDEITLANIHSDSSKLETVIKLFLILNESWVKIKQQ